MSIFSKFLLWDPPFFNGLIINLSFFFGHFSDFDYSHKWGTWLINSNLLFSLAYIFYFFSQMIGFSFHFGIFKFNIDPSTTINTFLLTTSFFHPFLSQLFFCFIHLFSISTPSISYSREQTFLTSFLFIIYESFILLFFYQLIFLLQN